jgi:hypothetical protein
VTRILSGRTTDSILLFGVSWSWISDSNSADILPNTGSQFLKIYRNQSHRQITSIVSLLQNNLKSPVLLILYFIVIHLVCIITTCEVDHFHFAPISQRLAAHSSSYYILHPTIVFCRCAYLLPMYDAPSSESSIRTCAYAANTKT